MKHLKWGNENHEDLRIYRSWIVCWSVFRGAALVPHWRALVEPWVLQTWATCPAFTSHRHGRCQPISTGSQQDVMVQHNFTRFCSFCCVYHLVWTVNQSINQPTNQPTNQSTNQSINQSSQSVPTLLTKLESAKRIFCVKIHGISADSLQKCTGLGLSPDA